MPTSTNKTSSSNSSNGKGKSGTAKKQTTTGKTSSKKTSKTNVKKTKQTKTNSTGNKNNAGVYVFLVAVIALTLAVIVYSTLIFPKKLSSMITENVKTVYNTNIYDDDNPRMVIFRLQQKPSPQQQEKFAALVKHNYSLDVEFTKIANSSDKGINKISFAKNGSPYKGLKDFYIYWDNMMSAEEDIPREASTATSIRQKPRRVEHSMTETPTTLSQKPRRVEHSTTTTAKQLPMSDKERLAKDNDVKEKNEIKSFVQRQKDMQSKPAAETPKPAPKPSPIIAEPQRPVVPVQGRLTVIIDDVGYAYEATDGFLAIGVPITFAIIPETPKASHYYNLITSHNYEAIIHVPMEPEKGRNFVEPNALLTEMSDIEITTALQRFFMEMPACIGANNHMGSKAVTDGNLMNSLIGYLARNNTIWIDSMTNLNSLTGEFAGIYNMPDLHRDVFLDNQKDLASLEQSMELLIKEAKKKGYAIGIGHAQTQLLPQVLKKYYDRRNEYGVEFITLRKHLQ